MAFPWSEQLEELILELWKQGKTGADIQRELMTRTSEPITRSAVIGKLRRLGAPKRLRPEVGSRQATAKRVEIARRHAAETKKAACVVHTPRQTAPAPSQAPDPLNIPLSETGSKKCKYIPGHDDRCCGHPVRGGSTYCEYHYLKCRQEEKKRSPSRPAQSRRFIDEFESVGSVAERVVSRLMAGC